MNVIVFFPWPKYSWEQAFRWTRERPVLYKSESIVMTNPNHWDRINILKEKDSLLSEDTFAWQYNLK